MYHSSLIVSAASIPLFFLACCRHTHISHSTLAHLKLWTPSSAYLLWLPCTTGNTNSNTPPPPPLLPSAQARNRGQDGRGGERHGRQAEGHRPAAELGFSRGGRESRWLGGLYFGYNTTYPAHPESVGVKVMLLRVCALSEGHGICQKNHMSRRRRTMLGGVPGSNDFVRFLRNLWLVWAGGSSYVGVKKCISCNDPFANLSAQFKPKTAWQHPCPGAPVRPLSLGSTMER